MRGFLKGKNPFNFWWSCDQPPQSRTLIFSFITAKLHIDCQNGVKKCGVIKRRKVSVSGKICGNLQRFWQKWTKINVQNPKIHPKVHEKHRCD